MARGSDKLRHSRNWHVIFVPTVLVPIPVFNIIDWLLSMILLTKALIPTAYYVHAERPSAHE
jgi:hypothetical protein